MARSEKSKKFESEMKNFSKYHRDSDNQGLTEKNNLKDAQIMAEKRFADLCGYDDTTKGPIPSDR